MERLREQIARNPSCSGLLMHIDHIEQYRTSDPSLALDAAKCLLESLAKTMLGDRNVSVEQNASFQEVIKRAVETSQSLISLTDDNAVKIISRGMINVSQEIGSLRNRFGWFSHGRDLRAERIDKISVDFVIDTTLSIAHFLFALHEEEKTTKTRIVYEDNPIFNLYFDSLFEECEFVIAGIHISPSRALFHEDIEAYRIQLNGFRQLKEFIINKLNGLCDSDDLRDLINFHDCFSEDELQTIREKYKSIRFYGEEPIETKQRFYDTFFLNAESKTGNAPSFEVIS